MVQITKIEADRRRSAVRQLRQQGHSYNAIAARLGLDKKSVYAYANRQNGSLPEREATSAMTDEMIAQAAALRLQGFQYRDIGRKLGVSESTAHRYVRMAMLAGQATGITHTRATTRQERAARNERIVAMSREGYREEAIAHEVGMTAIGVRKVLRKMGQRTLHERIGNQRRVDPNRVMDGILVSVQLAPEVIDDVDFRRLDPERLIDWSDRLTDSMRTLRRLRDRLRRQIDGDSSPQ